MTELSLELQESGAKLAQCNVSKQTADQRVMDLTQELENNAGMSQGTEFVCTSNVHCHSLVMQQQSAEVGLL